MSESNCTSELLDLKVSELPRRCTEEDVETTWDMGIANERTFLLPWRLKELCRVDCRLPWSIPTGMRKYVEALGEPVHGVASIGG